MRTFLAAFIAAGLMGLTIGAYALAEDGEALSGNHPAEALTIPSTGEAELDLPLTMEVRFAPRNRPALDKLLKEQQDPASPNYHKWLRTGEYDQLFGASPAQVNAVAEWLRRQGFNVISASPGGISFSG